MRDSVWGKMPFEITHTVDEHPRQSEFYMHAHEQYELLLFIAGDVTYLVEGELYHPQPYDMLIFNIAETHKVIINSDCLYERTVIKMDRDTFRAFDRDGMLFLPFTSRPNGKGNLLNSAQFTDGLWRLCLDKLQVTGQSEVYYLSHLAALLSEMCEVRAVSAVPSASPSLMQYVSDHCTDEDMTPESVAKRFFISKTTLYTAFKKFTGTTFHDYVTAKRLIIARELLRQGGKPTEVAMRCGFATYTTFFRTYKKRFGISPKEKF